MLINKGSSVGDVVSVKLVNGDEIICRLDEDNNDTFKFSKPLVVTLTPSGVGMLPWMFLADSENYTVKKEHVFALCKSKKEAADQYLQSTTGLSIARQ